MPPNALILALCGLTLAAAQSIQIRPQEIDINALDKLPPVSRIGPLKGAHSEVSIYIVASAAASAAAAIPTDPIAVNKLLAKRDCTTREPYGTGPVPGNGSASSYRYKGNELSQAAQNAVTPANYTEVFSNLLGASQQDGYLGFQTLNTNQYDVAQCAQLCSNDPSCIAFNIYYERTPAYVLSDTCTNPAPQTDIKCSLWGQPLSPYTATNHGQYGNAPPGAEAFHFQIAGSNGYNRGYTAPPADGYSDPTDLGNGAIISPNSDQSYLGYKVYNNGAYSPQVCAAACRAEADQARQSGNGQSCVFFNSYILLKNGVAQGTYCSFYSKAYDASYATNYGYGDGQGNTFTISNSQSYTLTGTT